MVNVGSANFHTIAVDAQGRVWGWGDNEFEEVGTGDPGQVYTTPQLVLGDAGVGIAAGQIDSINASASGAATAWGFNGSGELGRGDPTYGPNWPAPVQGLTGVANVSAGNAIEGALLVDGQVAMWGENRAGQLGNGSTDPYNGFPVLVTGIDQASAFSLGGAHGLVLKPDGSMVAWGFNREGELGDGTTVTRRTPVAVQIGGVAQPGGCSGGMSASRVAARLATGRGSATPRIPPR